MMRIALIGYGKMGKTIERLALEQGHEIVAKIDKDNANEWESIHSENTDVAIEFTQPDTAFENLKTCLEKKIPVVSGTTGWLDRKTELGEICAQEGGAFFYASNYSVGVNIFFQLNKVLAKLSNFLPAHKVEVEEVHHTEKKDAPSGTAITLAEGILEMRSDIQKWVNQPSAQDDTLGILSKREPEVPGTHRICYESNLESIEIQHQAFSREGFALGAITAAAWLIDKKGVFGMKDLLAFD